MRRLLLRSALAAGFAAAALTGALAGWSPAHAQIDTLEVWAGPMGRPVLASAPSEDGVPPYGAVHIGYTRSRHLRHAWRKFDVWMFEDVADSAQVYDIAVRDDGLASMALADYSGRLIFAERSPVGWTLDTLATYPGASLRLSMALGQEPGIAYAVIAGSTVFLKYARRSGTSWTITDIGTGVDDQYGPALAFDPQGLAAIATMQPGATGPEVVLYTATGADGPFIPAVVDSQGLSPVAVAWDLPRNRPFVAYRADSEEAYQGEYRATYRDNAGIWRHQTLGYPETFGFHQISLVLDSHGAPAVAWIRNEWILEAAGRGDVVTGGIETARVMVSTQRALAPSSSYEHTTLFNDVDGTMSGRGIGSHVPGMFDVCWRNSHSATPPFALLYAEVGNGVTGVPAGREPTDFRLALGPNPTKSGAVVAMSWAQSGSSDASFTLYDLAGRAVLTRAAGSRPAGAQEFSIALPRLGTGLYWLALSLDGRRVDSRPLVVR